MPTFILGEEEGVLHQDLGDQTLGTICCVTVDQSLNQSGLSSLLSTVQVRGLSL